MIVPPTIDIGGCGIDGEGCGMVGCCWSGWNGESCSLKLRGARMAESRPALNPQGLAGPPTRRYLTSSGAVTSFAQLVFAFV